MVGEPASRRADPLSAKLRVRLTPSGGADRIDGAARDENSLTYLKARVRAPPENGKANAALEKLVAKALGVAKSQVQVTHGHTARIKTLSIEGVSDAEAAAFVARCGVL